MIKTHGEYCGLKCGYLIYDHIELCYICERHRNRYGDYTYLRHDPAVNQIKRCAACKKENP